ncbi:sodium-dependent transporter [Candidatus Formimonas warabiya]|uniref:Transporter n=1 Tax=Formimonas warabiya TaxID=1761012 RepID=A0A3G1KUY9_FORW1|nr:sodium-dependent transporter [Candidatus Formimonas warabiya]ATW26298.1 transporter [Candidatus Formimonas warabiya]
MWAKKESREKFSTGLAVFFATLGSALGLGNIWKFPYLTGENGGGAFLFVYVICILFVGIPVMVCEFYIGRKTRKNAVGAFEKLKAHPAWKIIGFMGILSAYLIMFFYSCVAGWVYLYMFKAVKGDFASITARSAEAEFGSAVIGPWSPLIWQLIVLVAVAVILIGGVKKGIERVTKTLLPVLFILILVCDIRALTLPGASQGVQFLFHVDFARLTPEVILTALGLAFFKLSLGMGTMITYGSYFTDDNNMIATPVKVAASDTMVSLLAGIAIFPTVFSFQMEPGAGPGLLFMTIPLVFSQIPLGNILLVAFFFLTSIAATTAMISLVEVPVAYFAEERGISRTGAVIFNCFLIMLIGILATLSAHKAALLGKIPVFGKTFFDLFDYTSSNILLPVGGLLIALFVGHVVRKEEFRDELSNHGTLSMDGLINFVYFLIRWVTPVLLALVFLNSIGVLNI